MILADLYIIGYILAGVFCASLCNRLLYKHTGESLADWQFSLVVIFWPLWAVTVLIGGIVVAFKGQGNAGD